MEKQLTAVEWLVEQLKTMDTKSFNRLIQIEMSRENFEECFEQAKAMEKEQREKDFVEGYKKRALASNLIFDETSEYYAKTLFNRTYKAE